jgi:hypothetical protein
MVFFFLIHSTSFYIYFYYEKKLEYFFFKGVEKKRQKQTQLLIIINFFWKMEELENFLYLDNRKNEVFEFLLVSFPQKFYFFKFSFSQTKFLKIIYFIKFNN